MIALVLLSVVSLSFSQTVRLETVESWLENTNTLGGAIVHLTYPSIGQGCCMVELPEVVNLFHVMNGFIVPESTNPLEKLYKISAPTHWSMVNGTFKVLIIFNMGTPFRLDNIAMECNPSDISDINVYSFPQNNLKKTASSTVCLRPAFHQGDVLTITFPVPVKTFNFTTWDSSFSMTNDDNQVFTLSGFKAPFGNDHNTEVSFRFEYNDDDEDDTNWFAAGDVEVKVDRAPTLDPLLINSL